MRRLWGHFAALMVLTSVLVVGPAGTACACSCVVPNPVENAAWADLVFVGVVVDVDRPAFSLSSGDLMTARLTVEQVRKGAAQGHVEVKTALEGPSCGFDFVEGNRYLVYSRAGQTSLCSGNELLGAAPEVELEGDVPVTALLGGSAVVLLAALALWWALRRRPAQPASGPADAEPGPADAEPGPADAEPGPADAEPGPADAEPGPADAEPGPADAEPGPADAEPGPADAEPGPADAEPEPAAQQPDSGPADAGRGSEAGPDGQDSA